MQTISRHLPFGSVVLGFIAIGLYILLRFRNIAAYSVGSGKYLTCDNNDWLVPTLLWGLGAVHRKLTRHLLLVLS